MIMLGTPGPALAGVLEGFFGPLWKEESSDGMHPVAPFGGEAEGHELRVEVQDHGDRFTVTTDLPGLKIDDLEITVTGASIELRGRRAGPLTDDQSQFHRCERWYGPVEGSIRLAAPLEAARVSASISAGVLRIDAPKLIPPAPLRIPVTLR